MHVALDLHATSILIMCLELPVSNTGIIIVTELRAIWIDLPGMGWTWYLMGVSLTFSMAGKFADKNRLSTPLPHWLPRV